MCEKPTLKVGVKSTSKGELKAFGGSDRDQWNERLLTLVTSALPVNQKDTETVLLVGSAVAAGIADMQPADPIEAMLIAQLVVANEAALKLYRLAWLNNGEYFTASTKYLQLADKASRTIAMLTERLDQHRGRGQQQILVKHVNVNAEQAVITDTVVTQKAANSSDSAPALLTNSNKKPMTVLDERNQPVGVIKSK